ncbi:ParB/RepB/Spo0J family partition protein [Escherichia coli]
MDLDLTGLDQLNAEPGKETQGKPMMLEVSSIDPDPEQPRIDVENDPELPELVASVKARGVKTPISVRKNPDNPERWIINFGERRWVSSKLAGKTHIPAFEDEEADEYDQVNENLKRKALTTYEMARFIGRKIDSGIKAKEIAERLAVNRSFVSEHQKLWQSTDAIKNLMRTGLVGGKTLYMLASIDAKHSGKVEEFINSCGEDFSKITRASVTALIEELNSDPQRNEDGAEQPTGQQDTQPGSDGQNDAQGGAEQPTGQQDTQPGSDGQNDAQGGAEQPTGQQDTQPGSDGQNDAQDGAEQPTGQQDTQPGSDGQNDAQGGAEQPTGQQDTQPGSDGQNDAQEAESELIITVDIDGVNHAAVLVGSVRLKLIESDQLINVKASDIK